MRDERFRRRLQHTRGYIKKMAEGKVGISAAVMNYVVKPEEFGRA